MMTEATTKTYAAWSKSRINLDKFLIAGDYVDQPFIDWALSVLPPTCWTATIIQIGEPVNHVDGRGAFITFHHEDGKPWQYVGLCRHNECSQPDGPRRRRSHFCEVASL